MNSTSRCSAAYKKNPNVTYEKYKQHWWYECTLHKSVDSWFPLKAVLAGPTWSGNTQCNKGDHLEKIDKWANIFL